jgi:hypothetical protein
VVPESLSSIFPPDHYPGRQIPAHVHVSLWGGGYPFQYADELLFADDPLISAEERQRAAAAGKFSTRCLPMKDAGGTWHCALVLRVSTVTNYYGDQTPPK